MAASKELLEVMKDLRHNSIPSQKELEEVASGKFSRKLLKAILEKTLNSGIVLEGIDLEDEVEEVEVL